MPCAVHGHEHVWTTSGELSIKGCEVFCGFCKGPAALKNWKYVWFLARHVRSQHARDMPDLGEVTVTKKYANRVSLINRELTSGIRARPSKTPKQEGAGRDAGKLARVEDWLQSVDSIMESDMEDDGGLDTGFVGDDGGMALATIGHGEGDAIEMGAELYHDDINYFDGIGGLPGPQQINNCEQHHMLLMPRPSAKVSFNMPVHHPDANHVFANVVEPLDQEKATTLLALLQQSGNLATQTGLHPAEILYVVLQFAETFWT